MQMPSEMCRQSCFCVVMGCHDMFGIPLHVHGVHELVGSKCLKNSLSLIDGSKVEARFVS